MAELSYKGFTNTDIVAFEQTLRRILANPGPVSCDHIPGLKMQNNWRARRDSNTRPTDSKSGALSS